MSGVSDAAWLKSLRGLITGASKGDKDDTGAGCVPTLNHSSATESGARADADEPTDKPGRECSRLSKGACSVKLREPGRKLETIFEHEGMTKPVFLGTRRLKNRPRSPRGVAKNRQKPFSGPPIPDVGKAIALAGKTTEGVASEMQIPVEELQGIIEQKDELVTRWAPVLAKCTRLARIGLLRLISRQCPCGCASVGHHIYLSLTGAGDRAIARCREHLTQGWDGWQYRLSDTMVDTFWEGKSKEAERVADVLLRLANATDRGNIFCIFVQ